MQQTMKGLEQKAEMVKNRPPKAVPAAIHAVPAPPAAVEPVAAAPAAEPAAANPAVPVVNAAPATGAYEADDEDDTVIEVPKDLCAIIRCLDGAKMKRKEVNDILRAHNEVEAVNKTLASLKPEHSKVAGEILGKRNALSDAAEKLKAAQEIEANAKRELEETQQRCAGMKRSYEDAKTAVQNAVQKMHTVASKVTIILDDE